MKTYVKRLIARRMVTLLILLFSVSFIISSCGSSSEDSSPGSDSSVNHDSAPGGDADATADIDTGGNTDGSDTGGNTDGTDTGGNTGNDKPTFSYTKFDEIDMEFVLIEAKDKCFQMGRSEDENGGDGNELPAHKVCFTKNFYLGKTEVTQAQWSSIMGSSSNSYFQGDDRRPVENISWAELNASNGFIAKLNTKAGSNIYRLPTEAEWEYAARARAGSTTRYFFGSDDAILGEYAWFLDNSESTTHPVGEKKPNSWGLHDIYGNVVEWVMDNKESYPSGQQTDPLKVTSGRHVLRGGSWKVDGYRLRSAYRRGEYDKSNETGFRLLKIAK